VLFDNTSTVFVAAATASTSDIGQGLQDLGNGALAAIGAIGSAVGAAAAFDSGNIGAGIVASAGAISSGEKAYQDFTTPAAQDAISDIVNSINSWLGFDDPDWNNMWSDAVGASSGSPALSSGFSRDLTRFDPPGFSFFGHHS
jgi:hypothetical protein